MRPGEDGDYVYKGFSNKSLLDILSRGLQRRPAPARAYGDLRPSHRIAVFDVEEDAENVGQEQVKITDIVSQSDMARRARPPQGRIWRCR